MKKLKGIIISKNSGILSKINQITASLSKLPLTTSSKYWMDLEENVMKRKIKLTDKVCEKISLTK